MLASDVLYKIHKYTPTTLIADAQGQVFACIFLMLSASIPLSGLLINSFLMWGSGILLRPLY